MSFRLLAGYVVTAFALMTPSLAACPTGAITAVQAHEDIELVIAAVEMAIPDLYWRQTPRDWSGRKATARALAAAAVSEEALFLAMRPLLAGIGEGHLSLHRGDGMSCRYRDTALVLPLDLLWRDDGAFVTAAYGDADDIPAGTALLAINGKAPEEMLADMMKLSAHDGIIQTGVMRDRAGRGYAVVRWWMYGNEPWYDVRLRLPDGHIIDRRLTGVPVSARPEPDADPSPVATLQWVDHETAYLYVPTFSNRRYREAGAEFRTTIQAIFDTLAERGARNLILDLRDNGGGAEPNESILFSYLVAEPIRKYASVRSRANRLRAVSLSGKLFEHDIYEPDELPTVRLDEEGGLTRINAPPNGLMTGWARAHPIFRGRLIVLAGGYTFSGGAELASMLRVVNRGLFIGEEIGGAHGGNTSGYEWDLTLPNSGMEIQIPLLAFRFVWAEPVPNRGVMPDCPVQPSVGEQRVGNDAAYQAALQSLKKTWTLPLPDACPKMR